MSRAIRVIILGTALLMSSASAVGAQGPEPVDQPPEFATVRAEFEDLTGAEVEAAGYVAEPVCISDPAMGGMGIHAIHPTLWDEQYNSGEPDIANPPVVLLSADKSTVVGLEWESIDMGDSDMELFGQPFLLLPGHPGVPEPHHMFHAYFKPDGQVLFSVFDPELSCTVPSTAMETNAPTAISGWTLLGLAALSMTLAVVARRARSVVRR